MARRKAACSRFRNQRERPAGYDCAGTLAQSVVPAATAPVKRVAEYEIHAKLMELMRLRERRITQTSTSDVPSPAS